MIKKRAKAKAKPAARKTAKRTVKRKAAKKKTAKKKAKRGKAKPKAKASTASHKAGKVMKKKAVVTRAKAAKPSKKATLRVAKTASKSQAKTKTLSKKKVTKAVRPEVKKQATNKTTTKSRMVKVMKQSTRANLTPPKTSKSKAGHPLVALPSHFEPITDELIYKEIPPYQEIPGEEYMNPKQQAHFRRILLQRKQQFLQEMERTVHHLQDEAANFPDPNDRATQEEEFSLELRARDRERKFIKNIEEALGKLDEGEYGYCDACGVEIGIRRLEARPTANLCIDCKTLDEIRERQIGG